MNYKYKNILFMQISAFLLMATDVTWDGGGGNDNFSIVANWDVAASNDDNLIFSGATRLTPNNDSFTSFTNITFDNTSGAFSIGGSSITLKGDITNNDTDLQTLSNGIVLNPGNRTFHAASGNISHSGILSGSGDLTKTGTNNLILSADNTYSGATAISVGKVQIDHLDALGDTGAPTSTTVASGASLVINASGSLNDENFTISGTGVSNSGALDIDNVNLTIEGTINLAADSSIDVNSTRSLSLTGAVSGSSALTKTGNGILSLSAANTYTGATTVSNGFLWVNHEDALGDAGSSTTTTVDTGAELRLNITGGGAIDHENISISGNGRYGALNGAIYNTTGDNTISGTLTLDSHSSIGVASGLTLTQSGIIDDGAGTYGLTKILDGTLVLSGANTYGSGTTISAGKVQIDHLDALGDSGAPTSTTVASGASLVLNASGFLNRENFTISGTGVSNSGVLDVDNASLTIQGTINLAADSSIDVNSARSLSLAGVVSGSSALTKTGTGILSLSAANTYTGATTVSNGFLWVNHEDALGDAGSSTTTTVDTGAELRLNITGGGAIDHENISISGNGRYGALNGAIYNTTGDNTISGTLTLDSHSSIGVASGLTLTQSGIIDDGAGTYGLTKILDGTLVLSGANTYGSGTTISAGKVQIDHLDALGDSGAPTSTTVASGASLVLNASGFLNRENFTISGTGVSNSGVLDVDNASLTIEGTVNLAADSSIDVNVGRSLSLTGVVSGSSALTKTGNGILSLSAANTYTGATTISNGMLWANHEDALGDAGSSTTTTVDNGAELRLNITGGGTIDNENISISGNGFVGSSNGAIYNTTGDNTISGTLTLDASSSIGVASGLTLTQSGIIDDGVGTYGITKILDGTLVLNGANTYGGSTIVSAGTLNLTGSIDGDLQINGGTVWGGNSADAVAGDLTISNGTITADSNTNTGKFNITGVGTSTWTGGTYIWNVLGGMESSGTDSDGNGYYEASGADDGTHYDVLAFSGALDFTGASASSITIQIDSQSTYTGYDWSTPTEIKIASYASITNFNESYFNIDASSFNDGTGAWWLNWGITSHDQALWLKYNAVPEPGTWFIMTALPIVFFSLWIRRKII
jgi:autotransporter-associated beta strand protein